MGYTPTCTLRSPRAFGVNQVKTKSIANLTKATPRVSEWFPIYFWVGSKIFCSYGVPC
tara:strand:+ start:231 stop:404 length:174 start_codon:yes stop_codon:yes gene_type:complete